MMQHTVELVLFSGIFFGITLDCGSSIAVTIGQTASMECYDPEVAQNNNDMFVVLEFKSSLPNSHYSRILTYKPFTDGINLKDPAYKGRVHFHAGMFNLKYIGANDEGTFSCTPKGFGLFENITKTVIKVYVTPHLDVKMIDQFLKVGDSFVDVATCSARQGKPPPQVDWKHEGFQIEYRQLKTNTTNDKLTSVESTLQVVPRKSYNKQSFRCETRHAAFSKINISIITLNITYPPNLPRIIVHKSKKSLTCFSDGNPPPNYEWTLPMGSNPPKYSGASVTLANPYDPNHQNDTYTCIASNIVGHSAPVNVSIYEALLLAEITQQANVSLIVGISLGIFVFLLLILGSYCLFVRSRDKKDPMNKKQYLHAGNKRHLQTEFYHPSSDLYRPPNHLFHQSDTYDRYFYDDDGGDGEDEYHFDVDADFRSGSKVDFANTSVNFKKQQPPQKKFKNAYNSEESSDEAQDDASFDSRMASPRYACPPYEASSNDESSMISDDRPCGPPQSIRNVSKFDENSEKLAKSYTSGKAGSYKTKPLMQYSEV